MCCAGFLETLSAIPDSYIFSARHPFHFYLVKGKRQKMVLFEGRFEQPKENTPKETSDYVTEKVGVEGEKKQDNANGNRNPENGNRLPALNRFDNRPQQPQRQQVNNGDLTYENQPQYPYYQPTTPRPKTYAQYGYTYQ